MIAAVSIPYVFSPNETVFKYSSRISFLVYNFSIRRAKIISLIAVLDEREPKQFLTEGHLNPRGHQPDVSIRIRIRQSDPVVPGPQAHIGPWLKTVGCFGAGGHDLPIEKLPERRVGFIGQ